MDPRSSDWRYGASVALSLAVALGGCGSYRQTRSTGAGIMAAGAVTAGLAGLLCLPYAFPAPQDEDPDKDEDLGSCKNLAIAGGIIAAIGLPFFIYGNHGADDEQAEESRQTEARYQVYVEERRRMRERALTSTQQAAAEARAGNCALAVSRDPVIHDLDAEVHASMFMRDVAIKACLFAASTEGKEQIAREKRRQAFALLKIATQAAHEGNCAQVLELGHKIRALDVNFHGAWFVYDKAIKPCLAEADAPHLPAD